MRLPAATVLLCSLLLLGCYSTLNGDGSDASVITTSKNFTMREGWQEDFRLVSGETTSLHKVLVVSVASKAVMLKIDSKSILLRLGETSSVSLSGKTVFVTLNEVEDEYARFRISLSEPGQTPQPPPSDKVQNGGNCSSDSQCQSNHCSNGYCCASGSCCVSDSNCSVGKCNMTKYSCFTITLLSAGSPCNSNADCQSNHCNNGYCCASGKCCLSNSNCASGEICNTTNYSCAQSAPTYSTVDAERKANSTPAGQLITRFSAIFESARQCQGGSDTYKQCIPLIATRTDRLATSTFKVTYSYSFNGTSCCPMTDVLALTVDLSTNTTSTQWLDTSITSSLANSMNSSLNSNCVSAIQYIACRY